METIGERLRLERLLAMVPQYKVAIALGICATRLSEIENGKRQPSPEMVSQIRAAILEVGGSGIRN